MLCVYQLLPAATGTPLPDPSMEQASGDDFDRMYIHSMVPGHRATVRRFQNYAITGKDPLVREFAKEMIPILKEHLKTIEALDEKYKDLSAK